MTVSRQRRIWTLLICALAALAGGCSSGESPSEVTGAPTAKESLNDLVSLLKHLKSENKPPPAKMADILPIEPLFQGAYLGLVRDEIVYVWGSPIDPAGRSKVLAYEKAVESGSGYVLMQDGSVQTMEAAEFTAAQKAAPIAAKK